MANLSERLLANTESEGHSAVTVNTESEGHSAKAVTRHLGAYERSTGDKPKPDKPKPWTSLLAEVNPLARYVYDFEEVEKIIARQPLCTKMLGLSAKEVLSFRINWEGKSDNHSDVSDLLGTSSEGRVRSLPEDLAVDILPEDWKQHWYRRFEIKEGRPRRSREEAFFKEMQVPIHWYETELDSKFRAFFKDRIDKGEIDEAIKIYMRIVKGAKDTAMKIQPKEGVTFLQQVEAIYMFPLYGVWALLAAQFMGFLVSLVAILQFCLQSWYWGQDGGVHGQNFWGVISCNVHSTEIHGQQQCDDNFRNVLMNTTLFFWTTILIHVAMWSAKDTFMNFIELKVSRRIHEKDEQWQCVIKHVLGVCMFLGNLWWITWIQCLFRTGGWPDVPETKPPGFDFCNNVGNGVNIIGTLFVVSCAAWRPRQITGELIELMIKAVTQEWEVDADEEDKIILREHREEKKPKTRAERTQHELKRGKWDELRVLNEITARILEDLWSWGSGGSIWTVGFVALFVVMLTASSTILWTGYRNKNLGHRFAVIVFACATILICSFLTMLAFTSDKATISDKFHGETLLNVTRRAIPKSKTEFRETAGEIHDEDSFRENNDSDWRRKWQRLPEEPHLKEMKAAHERFAQELRHSKLGPRLFGVLVTYSVVMNFGIWLPSAIAAMVAVFTPDKQSTYMTQCAGLMSSCASNVGSIGLVLARPHI